MRLLVAEAGAKSLMIAAAAAAGCVSHATQAWLASRLDHLRMMPVLTVSALALSRFVIS